MKRSIIIGPIAAYFANRNAVFNLPLHTHYCEVRLAFETRGTVGFPVFADSIECLTKEIREFLKPVFDGDTNEVISEKLFSHLSQWRLPQQLTTPGQYELQWLELAVRCVADDLGHADIFARYVAER